MQSNVRSSYQDFKVLIDNIVPNDYVYMRLTQEMAAIGFFSLAELSMSKIQDNQISSLIEEDVKTIIFQIINLRIKTKCTWLKYFQTSCTTTKVKKLQVS